ncbi:hypothetical protein C7B61_01670 [filamentous cyanobacterium CCP1]|nr:hypothetical protein C7B76_05480 [filamentous cyanobacterium CCP2]PSB68290.1 hypothetical protein C7B61_01670 [filamentous cyanobacterium CCP1]
MSDDLVVKGKRPLFDALTGVRALGAWWVVLFHIRGELARFVPNESFMMRFADAGHVGITLFFVLSGFVIAYNYAPRFQSLRTGSYLKFLWQRLARIYPVHVATLLALACILIAASFTGIHFGESERYTLDSFVQHLFLISAWSVPLQVTWNGVAWTLSLEWLCYIMFPILAVVTFRIRNPIILICTTVALVVVTSILRLAIGMPELIGKPIDFFQYLLANIGTLSRHPSLFMLGFLMYRLYDIKFGSGFNWRFINLIVFPGFILTAIVQPFLGGNNLLVIPFVALLIYGLAWDKGEIVQFFKSKSMMYWGYTSYALFMTHPICLLILRKVFPLKDSDSSNIILLFFILIIYLFLISLIARITYIWLEEPARDWMRGKKKIFGSSGHA